MKPQTFVRQYAEYFGEAAQLPLAVCYTDSPLSEPRAVEGCMFKLFHRACKGETVTYSCDSLSCGGGKLYTGLGPMPERVYKFVSEIERYKSNPEVAKEAIRMIDASQSSKSYINFIRIDKLENLDGIEGLIFFATPDILSGLFAWANYDQTDINAVQAPWGSGCSSSITALVNENRRGGKHCFIGMLDVSARPYFKSSILSFAIPMSRFIEMTETFAQCCVAGAPAWMKVRKRINLQ